MLAVVIVILVILGITEWVKANNRKAIVMQTLSQLALAKTSAQKVAIINSEAQKIVNNDSIFSFSFSKADSDNRFSYCMSTEDYLGIWMNRWDEFNCNNNPDDSVCQACVAEIYDISDFWNLAGCQALLYPQ